ncbi:hypothetical protein [Zooshikella harenae]|uniref:Nudix hydrolase domain-containing protein n=1 Tax=Zooshikella harenae TaxID=2827238 RepID=A0ABS5ZAT8_9GAMM|nr:hypothetical protein [Zooshikella harenae]MBU2710868.1 hypothetical protein [Zooshikella harenae]
MLVSGTLLHSYSSSIFSTYRQSLWLIKHHDSSYQANLQSWGEPLSFAQLHRLRTSANNSAIKPDNCLSNVACILLNNLGVSAHITVQLQGCRWLLLVPQLRHDFGDTVLKLPSGYVPSESLSSPQKTVLQEVAEELLWLTPNKKQCPISSFNQKPLPHVYSSIPIRSQSPTAMMLSFAQSPHQRMPVYYTNQFKGEQSHLYLHQPTQSAQLVSYFELKLLPNFIQHEKLSLFHCEDVWNDDSQRVEVRFNENAFVIWAEINENNQLTGKAAILQRGQLTPVSDTKKLYLSEYFCRRQGIWVKDNNRPFLENTDA